MKRMDTLLNSLYLMGHFVQVFNIVHGRSYDIIDMPRSFSYLNLSAGTCRGSKTLPQVIQHLFRRIVGT